jgi:hypothetical protein
MHDDAALPGENPPTNGGDSADRSPQMTDEQTLEQTRERLRSLPKEVGLVLVTFGFAGLILPGPFGTPFLLAGGLVLGPRIFHRAERWVEERFPGMHHEGRRHVDRFLDDFESRYPRHSP